MYKKTYIVTTSPCLIIDKQDKVSPGNMKPTNVDT